MRTLLIDRIETRDAGGAGTKIEGRAVVYDQFTELMDWWGQRFYERIESGALTETLADGHDIFALKNHDWSIVLGRTGANLVLKNQDTGLYFDLTPNSSSAGRDMLEDVRSGLIKGCSFGFRIAEDGQYWEEKDGDWFRTITKLSLREITLTPIPAYTATTAEVRSLTPTGARNPPAPDAEQEERAAILAEATRIQKQMGS